MRQLSLFLLLTLGLVAPAAAMSIKGVELTPTDAARVDRQCNVLRFRADRSLGSDAPEEPAPGYVVSDPASYWSNSADASDAALIKGINLDAITERDCRRGGFYKN